MDYLKAKFKRKEKGKEKGKGKGQSSQPVASTAAAVKTDQRLSPSGPAHFASPTTETPEFSHEYQNNFLLRKYVLGFAKLFSKGVIPYREILLLPCPIGVVIKYGAAVQLAEASTLRFLSKTTSVPVPKVYCAFTDGEVNYIMMEYIKGKPIGAVWDDTSPAKRKMLSKQLKRYFNEMRSIPHPRAGVICGASTGPLIDRRIGHDHRGFGPFANERDFNNFLRCGVGQSGELGAMADSSFDDREDLQPKIQKLITIQDSKSHKICFTHGDAHSGNFLVRASKIVAIIDFEMSGFFPEHWEYTTAMTTAQNVQLHDDGFWKLELKNILEEYPRELEAEILRQEIFGERTAKQHETHDEAQSMTLH
ncbi:hypothetical protein LOCC1_G008236 [Lachnellula occidentalis]|uniref:Aminoglycoside phosphotransferase domain-containing protein n=1 Tax=Lachnellula occidentalis TaxID=215460 RepID=A0A8H8U6U9_9HELO|nr:hypothetical protein LOCC1_G008236 [Lachnellula occidentalis]